MRGSRQRSRESRVQLAQHGLARHRTASLTWTDVGPVHGIRARAGLPHPGCRHRLLFGAWDLGPGLPSGHRRRCLGLRLLHSGHRRQAPRTWASLGPGFIRMFELISILPFMIIDVVRKMGKRDSVTKQVARTFENGIKKAKSLNDVELSKMLK